VAVGKRGCVLASALFHGLPEVDPLEEISSATRFACYPSLTSATWIAQLSRAALLHGGPVSPSVLLFMRTLSAREVAKRQRARQRKSFARWLAKPGNLQKHNARCREAYRTRRREMVSMRPPKLLDDLSIVQLGTLKSPRTSFIDGDGKISHEDFRSASEVIRDWKRAQREEKKREQEQRKRRPS
jgi:hypothetical protein